MAVDRLSFSPCPLSVRRSCTPSPRPLLRNPVGNNVLADEMPPLLWCSSLRSQFDDGVEQGFENPDTLRVTSNGQVIVAHSADSGDAPGHQMHESKHRLGIFAFDEWRKRVEAQSELGRAELVGGVEFTYCFVDFDTQS